MTNTSHDSGRHPSFSPALKLMKKATQKANLPGTLGLVAVFILMSAAMSAYIMMASSDHNENMYVAAGALLRDKQIYKDFAYVQMPYLPILYSFLYQATGTDRLLFAARAATCVLWAAAAFALLAAARVVSGSRPFSWCAFLMFATNSFVRRASTECSNYVSPMACFNIALLLFVMGTQPRRRRPLFLASSGLFAALAVGLKLYYIAVVPALFVLALLFPRDEGARRRILFGALPLCTGFLVGIAPAFLIMSRDSQRFLFNNLLFHRITTRAYVEHALPVGPMATGVPLTLHGKFHWLRHGVLEEPSVQLVFVGIAYAALVRWGKAAKKGLNSSAPLALGVSSLLLAAVVVVSMTPLWSQYLAFPMPFAILVFAGLHGQLQGWRRRANLRLAWVLAGACFLVNGPAIVRMLPHFVRPARFVPMEFHRTALAVGRIVGGDAKAGPIATFMPIYPLEAGLPIYDELSTGIFLYWIGDRLTETDRRHYVGTGPGSVELLLEERPPRAILVGNYPDEDAPLIRYAQRHRYRRFDKRDAPDLARLILYVQGN